ncbi:hypothetical protein AHAT_16300 [Agarivorans sp. Toyoura001]|uniref:SRPBCC family protein n=1 Tax=Agarivorans sp. Toyoura001 TaxID=2283141 RepID=UPI0010DE8448|nr:SRPBCC family protein [Agarivorans sp. Toyoura001]GDY25740.1 hypothetical protein AHAT_16300 [Agarivorans sp. Toyoura001]
MDSPSKITWPDYYHPRNSHIHVKNQIQTAVTAENIWACLVRAPCWPNWKHTTTSLQILNGDGIELHKGSIFKWQTKKLSFECTVVEYQTHKKLAWKGKSGSMDMYHAWLLQENDNGCEIYTETTQRNGMTWLSKYFAPKHIHLYHQQWLDELQQQAK